MNIQTVGDLLELLADYDPDQPLLLATQPHYPLAYRLAGATEAPPASCECADHDHPVPRYLDSEGHHPECPAAAEASVLEDKELATVWLLQGNHTDRPYDVPENLWAELGF